MTIASVPTGYRPSPWWTGPVPAPRPPLAGDVRVDYVVVGGGLAGLAAAYHLRRRGFVGLGPNDDGAAGVPDDAPGTFVVLDAETAPGGAWQHRWDSLTMATVNHIHLLEPLEKGRLVRTAGDFLFTAAQGSNGRRWSSVEATALDGDGGNYQPKVTCSKCLSLARHWIRPE